MADQPNAQTKSIPKKPIIGLRTFAQDLERSRPTLPAVVAAAIPKPIIQKPEINEVSEDHSYQSPQWRKAEIKPATTKLAAQPIIKVGDTEPITPTATKKPLVPRLTPLPAAHTKKITPQSVTEEHIVVNGNDEDAASATIIRDTKKNRFRLFPAISEAINRWLEKFKEQQAERRKPKYVVPDTNLRKGLVQKATSKTGKVASFDNDSMQDRIRRRDERTTPTILAPAPETTVTWSPNTEPGYALLAAPEEKLVSAKAVNQISNVEIEPRRSYQTPVAATTKLKLVAPRALPDPVPIPEPEPELIQTMAAIQEIGAVTSDRVIEPVVTLPRLDTPPAPPTPRAPQIAPEVVLPNQVPIVSPATIVTPRPPAADPAPITLRQWILTHNTNTTALGIGGVVVVGLMIFGTIYTFISSAGRDFTLVNTPKYESLINAPIQLVSPSAADRNNIIASIRANIEGNTLGALQIALTTTTAGQELISSTRILSLLAPTLKPSFTESINRLYFGSLSQTQPFILMRSTDAIAARGGLLNWERIMATDLAPVLATNPNHNSSFKDVVIDTYDVRVAINPAGEELLAYTIIDRSLIIITHDTNTLRSIISLVIKI